MRIRTHTPANGICLHMFCYSMLPEPKRTSIAYQGTHSDIAQLKTASDKLTDLVKQSAEEYKSKLPSYGHRSGFRPRTPEVPLANKLCICTTICTRCDLYTCHPSVGLWRWRRIPRNTRCPVSFGHGCPQAKTILVLQVTHFALRLPPCSLQLYI